MTFTCEYCKHTTDSRLTEEQLRLVSRGHGTGGCITGNQLEHQYVSELDRKRNEKIMRDIGLISIFLAIIMLYLMFKPPEPQSRLYIGDIQTRLEFGCSLSPFSSEPQLKFRVSSVGERKPKDDISYGAIFLSSHNDCGINSSFFESRQYCIIYSSEEGYETPPCSAHHPPLGLEAKPLWITVNDLTSEATSLTKKAKELNKTACNLNETIKICPGYEGLWQVDECSEPENITIAFHTCPG